MNIVFSGVVLSQLEIEIGIAHKGFMRRLNCTFEFEFSSSGPAGRYGTGQFSVKEVKVHVRAGRAKVKVVKS